MINPYTRARLRNTYIYIYIQKNIVTLSRPTRKKLIINKLPL